MVSRFPSSIPAVELDRQQAEDILSGYAHPALQGNPGKKNLKNPFTKKSPLNTGDFSLLIRWHSICSSRNSSGEEGTEWTDERWRMNRREMLQESFRSLVGALPKALGAAAGLKELLNDHGRPADHGGAACFPAKLKRLEALDTPIIDNKEEQE